MPILDISYTDDMVKPAQEAGRRVVLQNEEQLEDKSCGKLVHLAMVNQAAMEEIELAPEKIENIVVEGDYRNLHYGDIHKPYDVALSNAWNVLNENLNNIIDEMIDTC